MRDRCRRNKPVGDSFVKTERRPLDRADDATPHTVPANEQQYGEAASQRRMEEEIAHERQLYLTARNYQCCAPIRAELIVARLGTHSVVIWDRGNQARRARSERYTSHRVYKMTSQGPSTSQFCIRVSRFKTPTLFQFLF